MGFFGMWAYDGRAWHEVEGPLDLDPSLFVVIHDSDLAQVSYLPAGEATGTAFVGFTPRTYFDDDTASEPTDPDLEARGLAAWAASVTGTEVDPAVVRGFLAADEDDDDFGDEVDVDALDEAEIFVELKVRRLLEALGLPLPADLDDAAGPDDGQSGVRAST